MFALISPSTKEKKRKREKNKNKENPKIKKFYDDR